MFSLLLKDLISGFYFMYVKYNWSNCKHAPNYYRDKDINKTYIAGEDTMSDAFQRNQLHLDTLVKVHVYIDPGLCKSIGIKLMKQNCIHFNNCV